jgi:hypothetical protein
LRRFDQKTANAYAGTTTKFVAVWDKADQVYQQATRVDVGSGAARAALDAYEARGWKVDLLVNYMISGQLLYAMSFSTRPSSKGKAPSPLWSMLHLHGRVPILSCQLSHNNAAILFTLCKMDAGLIWNYDGWKSVEPEVASEKAKRRVPSVATAAYDGRGKTGTFFAGEACVQACQQMAASQRVGWFEYACTLFALKWAGVSN